MNCPTCTTGVLVNYKDLNERCFCGDANTTSPYATFSSHSPVFISHKIEKNIQEAISVLEKVIQSDSFKRLLILDDVWKVKNSSGGILSCYDFHLDGEIPKLIEINTNCGTLKEFVV